MIIIQVQGVLFYEVSCLSGIYIFLKRYTLLSMLSGCATKDHQKHLNCSLPMCLMAGISSACNQFCDDIEKKCAHRLNYATSCLFREFIGGGLTLKAYEIQSLA